MDDILSIDHVDTVNLGLVKRNKVFSVSTDTRTLKAGDLFFALRGEKTDGHKFLPEAFAKGAACVVVDQACPREALRERPAVIVRDTTRALGQLAHRYRSRFSIPVVAIGGSNGKTTTKEMVSAVLRKRYNVHQTKGNLNNHIGVPMTLFGLRKRHEVAIVEIGTNHFGEVGTLSAIVQPTHAMVTTIEHEHLEFFGSIEGVAKEEGELYRSLDRRGVGFVNVDEKRIGECARSIRHKVTYGFRSPAGVHGTMRSVRHDGTTLFSVHQRRKKAYEVQLSIPGVHNATNALAAATVGMTFHVPVKDIQRALRDFRAVDKRMEILSFRGITIINDTYNANADSAIKALETLDAMNAKGKKIVVLGDMLELGSLAEAEHRKVGRELGRLGFKYLLTFGPHARFVNEAAGTMTVNLPFDQKNALAEYLVELIGPGDCVLVKGSRGMKMEDIVAFLKERARRKKG